MKSHSECDDKDAITQQKVMILIQHKYVLTQLIILDVVVMKVDTRLTSFMDLVGS
jgi:hypothetical protein